MAKRQNDAGQMSKEAYDAAQEDDRGDEGPGGVGQQKASSDVLQRRRIVKVNSKWKTGAGIRTPSAAMPDEATPARAPINRFGAAAATSNAGTSSNPFANTAFASNTSSPKPSTSSAVNPFATVSFAATPANKTVGFGRSGPIATSTKKMRLAATSFAPPTPAPVSKPLTPLRLGAKENENIDIDESTKKNLEMLKVVQQESITNPLSDYTTVLKKYIQNDSKSNANASDNSNGASLFGNGAMSSASPAAGSAPKTTFSFAAPAPDPAVANETRAEAAMKSESTPLFSFASAPAAPAEPKPFSGFSFGNGSAASSTPTPAPAPAPAFAPVEKDQEQDESAENEDDGAPGVVAGDLAENEKELHSCRAKYLRRIPSQDDPKIMEWKAFAAGVLRMYKNSDDGKCKVVLRDAAGKVRLNLNIAKETKFISLDAKNGTRGVQFLSIMDQKVGIEQFILKTRADNFDALVKALESMA